MKTQYVLILATCLAAPAGATVGADEEELRIESIEVGSEIGGARLDIKATGRAGAIDAFILSFSYDPDLASITDLDIAGTWVETGPPDFVLRNGTVTHPGEPGKALLLVILDLVPGDGEIKTIPPAPDGEARTIAFVNVDRHSGDNGTFDPVALTFEDELIRFRDGPALKNSLVISGVDYFADSDEHRLRLKNGGLVPPLGAAFRRGDANSDGSADISDAIFILAFLFLGTADLLCLDAVDVDDSGQPDISDPIFLLGALFLGTGRPPPPGLVACGLDPTADSLPACRYPEEEC